MNLLVAILLYLGFNYSPEQVTTLQASGQDENVEYAKYVRDNNFYTCNEEGVVIDVTVNP